MSDQKRKDWPIPDLGAIRQAQIPHPFERSTDAQVEILKRGERLSDYCFDDCTQKNCLRQCTGRKRTLDLKMDDQGYIADPYAGVSEEDMQAASDAFSTMMARRVERRRLERAVVTAAVKERATDKAVKAFPQWRPIEDRTDYSSQLMTLMAAQSLAKNGLHEAVDALAAFLEAHGEEK